MGMFHWRIRPQPGCEPTLDLSLHLVGSVLKPGSGSWKAPWKPKVKLIRWDFASCLMPNSTLDLPPPTLCKTSSEINWINFHPGNCILIQNAYTSRLSKRWKTLTWFLLYPNLTGLKWVSIGCPNSIHIVSCQDFLGSLYQLHDATRGKAQPQGAHWFIPWNSF